MLADDIRQRLGNLQIAVIPTKHTPRDADGKSVGALNMTRNVLWRCAGMVFLAIGFWKQRSDQTPLP